MRLGGGGLRGEHAAARAPPVTVRPPGTHRQDGGTQIHDCMPQVTDDRPQIARECGEFVRGASGPRNGTSAAAAHSPPTPSHTRSYAPLTSRTAPAAHDTSAAPAPGHLRRRTAPGLISNTEQSRHPPPTQEVTSMPSLPSAPTSRRRPPRRLRHGPLHQEPPPGRSGPRRRRHDHPPPVAPHHHPPHRHRPHRHLPHRLRRLPPPRQKTRRLALGSSRHSGDGGGGMGPVGPEAERLSGCSSGPERWATSRRRSPIVVSGGGIGGRRVLLGHAEGTALRLERRDASPGRVLDPHRGVAVLGHLEGVLHHASLFAPLVLVIVMGNYRHFSIFREMSPFVGGGCFAVGRGSFAWN